MKVGKDTMKSWIWSVLVFIITLVIALVFNIPFWIFLLVVIPLLIIAFTYGSFTYSFRASLQPEPLPARGHSSRIKALALETEKLRTLGFDKLDEFYLRMIPDIIVNVLKHEKDCIYFCLYHLGPKVTCDVVTRYRDDFTLTTCNNIDAGMVPRPHKNLLQIIRDVSYEHVLEKHRKAHHFLIAKRLKEYDIPIEEFRYYFLQSVHDQAHSIKKYPFWPLLLVFWTVTKRGRFYCKEIETQYKEGFITLYGA